MGHFAELFVFNGFGSISFRSNRLPGPHETASRSAIQF
jgi:hypothetical protein